MYSHGLLHGGLQAAAYHFLQLKIGPNLICQTVPLWIWSQPTILIIHTKTILPNQYNCEWNLIIVLLFFLFFVFILVGMFVWFIVVCMRSYFFSTNSKFQHHSKNDVPGQTNMLLLTLHVSRPLLLLFIFLCSLFFISSPTTATNDLVEHGFVGVLTCQI